MPTSNTLKIPKILATKEQFAKIIGISTRQVEKLQAQKGMFQARETEDRRKKYVLDKCVPEYIDYKLDSEARDANALDKEKQQTEHERIKKEISRLKLRKLRRELHEARDVEEYLTDMLTSFKGSLLAIPQKVAPLVVNEDDPNQIVSVLEKEIFAALECLSEYDPMKIDKEHVYSMDDIEDDEDEE